MDIKDFSDTDEFADMVDKRLKEEKVSAVASNDGLCEKEASWFNEYQNVDDFLFHHLGAEFPTNHDSASKNTIEAICRLAGLTT